MEAPRWSHRGKNDGYYKSIAVVVVAVVAGAMVTGCVAAVMVLE